MRSFASAHDIHVPVGRKLWLVSWPLVILLCITVAVGIAMLYSAGSGKWDPWAGRQLMRFGVCLAVALAVAVTDIRFWLRYAYWIYFGAVILLAGVEAAGSIGMGAQRWINLGIFQLQPSELMKIALILGLARYFNGRSAEEVARPVYLIVPTAMILAPAALVMKQPDLGTAVMLAISGAAIFFVAGVRLWQFGVVIGAALAAAPFAWHFLRGYQKQRILTFLDPESDPLGTGYHIIQSKIALGSGGIFGKGFLQGTQSHLNFLPEKQTDFIFTMLAEEFGLIGSLALIGLFVLIVIYGIAISLRIQNQFGRLLAFGVSATFFFYLFINVSMVMGLIPVVGVPLPLVSHGGTAMLAVMIGFGLVMSANIHRDVRIGRQGAYDDS